MTQLGHSYAQAAAPRQSPMVPVATGDNTMVLAGIAGHLGTLTSAVASLAQDVRSSALQMTELRQDQVSIRLEHEKMRTDAADFQALVRSQTQLPKNA